MQPGATHGGLSLERGEPSAREGAGSSGGEVAPWRTPGQHRSDLAGPSAGAADRGAPAIAPSVAEYAVSSPEAVAASPLVRSVAEAVAERLREAPARFEVVLEPESLGAVEVRLEVRGGAVHLGLLVQSAEAADALRTDLDELRASLARQGLDLAGVEVSTRDPREERRPWRFPEEDAIPSARVHPHVLPVARRAAPLAQRPAWHGALDIRV